MLSREKISQQPRPKGRGILVGGVVNELALQAIEAVSVKIPDNTRWWMPEEGSPLEDKYEFLSGFEEGDYLFKETEDSDPIPMNHIEQEGGGEGGGKYCYTVIQVGEKFYKIEYSYYSYNGYDYDGADVLE